MCSMDGYFAHVLITVSIVFKMKQAIYLSFACQISHSALTMDDTDSEETQYYKNFIIEVPFDYEPEELGLGYEYYISMKKHKNKIAQYIADTGEEDTYGEFLQRAIRTALELKKRNLTKDDVVSLCTYNHKNSAVPFVACTFLGIPVASLDPSLSLMDTIHLIGEVKPKLFFIVPEAVNLIEKSLEETGVEAEIVVFDDSSNHTIFSQFLQPNDEEESFVPAPAFSIFDTAVILFSSGTTGLPKGIMISSYALICQAVIFLNCGNMGPVLLSHASLYWISSVIFFTSCIFYGAAKVLCKKFDSERIWYLMEKYKISYLGLAPIQAVDIIKKGRPDGINTTSLMCCHIAGGSLSARLLNGLRDLLPGTFVSLTYGQSEVTGPAILFQLKHVEHRLSMFYNPESIGKPMPGMAYKVVDNETGKTCGPNEPGELRIKTKMVMNGYYNKDSSETFDSEGWLKTGDIVYFNHELCFFIVDRIKEMLKYQSWHVSPAMLEKVLGNHPAIQQVVVIGIPHEEDGDHPMALIVLNEEYNETVSAEDIEKFIDEKMPDRMRLRGGIKFIEHIPVTPSGKVKRKEIRDMVLNGLI